MANFSYRSVQATPFRLLTTADQSGEINCQSAYNAVADGTKKVRSADAEDMKFFGYTGAKRLLDMHVSLMPAGSAILEVGPYYNPLGHSLVEHPWIVWEYDATAAEKLLRENPHTVVFQVNLNHLFPDDWTNFLQANKEEAARVSNHEKFGGVILSSVLNYFDYHKALMQLVPNIREGGLLIVSNNGDGPLTRWKHEPPTGTQILETLLREFPNRITLLDGSKTDSGLGGTIRIQIAVQISWEKEFSATDLYELGIGFQADELSREINGVSLIDSFLILKTDAVAFQNRFYGDQTDSPQIQRWKEVRRVLITKSLEQRHRELWRLSRYATGSDQAEQLKVKLHSKRGFIPEREILLKALEIPDTKKRIAYLNLDLRLFYQRMGHPMPDINGTFPVAPYGQEVNDPRIESILEMYRKLRDTPPSSK